MRASRTCGVNGTAVVRAAVLGLGVVVSAACATDRSVSNPLGEVFPLVFDAEWVSLDIVGDSLEVRGIYLLKCRRATRDSIPALFPFPQDSLLGGARMVSLAFRADEGADAPGGWEELPLGSGVRWWIPPCRGETITATATYRQAIRTTYARYIVLTARLWGRPLRYAWFDIRLPEGAEPSEFSFPFERREVRGEIRYVYETEGFYPDRDVVVRWRAAPGRTGSAP